MAFKDIWLTETLSRELRAVSQASGTHQSDLIRYFADALAQKVGNDAFRDEEPLENMTLRVIDMPPALSQTIDTLAHASQVSPGRYLRACLRLGLC